MDDTPFYVTLAVLWAVPVGIIIGYLLRDKHDDR